MNNELDNILSSLDSNYEKLKICIEVQKLLELKKISIILSRTSRNDGVNIDKDNAYDNALSDIILNLRNAL